ncbi:MAG TPA: NAD-dependent epimerase/dehydratase family protein [Natronosporangium sp.]
MRIVVVGATGNVGSAVLRRLASEPSVDAVTGLARRPPPPRAGDRVDWRSIDIGGPAAVADLVGWFQGAAAVIHLAWQIQPSHDRAQLQRTNLQGTAHVAEAAVRAGVPALIVASSVGAYAPGPKDRRITEDWPVTGIAGASYSEDKAAMEALLANVARHHPELRLVLLRPGLIFQRDAGSEVARFFIGPLAPLGLLRYRRLPVVPSHPLLRVQGVHADDVADAYVRAALADVRGAFNIAADPVLDGASLAERFGGVTVPVAPAVLRAGANATWRARLQPTEPGWVKLAAGCPLLSWRRATAELGWQPTVTALDALAELFAGMASRAGGRTAALRPRPPASRRLAAMLTGRLPGHGDPY